MLHEINLHANRIVLVACRGAAVINLPGWIYALNHLTKDIELEVVLTHSAERLVSKNALTTVLEKNSIHRCRFVQSRGEGSPSSPC